MLSQVARASRQGQKGRSSRLPTPGREGEMRRPYGYRAFARRGQLNRVGRESV